MGGPKSLGGPHRKSTSPERIGAHLAGYISLSDIGNPRATLLSPPGFRPILRAAADMPKGTASVRQSTTVRGPPL
jgi:hypothetical protein